MYSYITTIRARSVFSCIEKLKPSDFTGRQNLSLALRAGIVRYVRTPLASASNSSIELAARFG